MNPADIEAINAKLDAAETTLEARIAVAEQEWWALPSEERLRLEVEMLSVALDSPRKFQGIDRSVEQGWWAGVDWPNKEPIATPAAYEFGPGIAALKLPDPRHSLDMSEWADEFDLLPDGEG